MSNMDTGTNKWVLDYTVAAAGDKTITMSTKDKFVDKDIEINLSVPAGAQSITGGALTSGSSSTTLASNGLSDGTNVDSTKAIVLSTTQAPSYYELQTSATATVNRAAVTKQITTAGYFAADSSASSVIAADNITVNDAGRKYYIAQSTLSSASVPGSEEAQTITISAGYYHEARTITIGGMDAATVTTDIADTGIGTYFTSGTSSDNSISLTPRYSVTASGYVATQSDTPGTTSYYKIKTTSVAETDTSVSGTSATRGTASWGTGWISSGSLSAAQFKNAGTSGKTYVDISGTTDAPVLVSGDYLYIDSGYVDDVKISLARLVPDGSDVKNHADYILSGHSAYDNDGVLVAGSISTYDGSYSIT